MVGPLVIADQRGVGLAARRAELVLVDLLEQLALVELHRPRQIAEQFALRQVDDPQLEVRARLAIHDEVVQAAPAAFELRKPLMVHDLVELSGQHAVAGRDRMLERAGQIAIEGDRAGKRLLDQGLDEFLGAVGFGLFGGRNHLLQQADGCRFSGAAGLASYVEIRNGSALLLAEPQLTRE